MKLFVCVLVVAIVHRSWSYPVGDQATLLNENLSSPSVDPKPADGRPKSELFASTPLPGEKPAPEAVPLKKEESAQSKKEEAPSANKEFLKEDKKEFLKEELPSSPASEKASIKEDATQEPFKPSSLALDDQSNKVSVSFDDSVKGVSDSNKPSEIHADKVPEKLVMKDEPLSKSANQQPNANNQVNAVTVDELRPVQNVVMPKEEIKTGVVVVEKKDEVKQKEKVEEPAKKYDSSEEKSESSEQEMLNSEQTKESSEKSVDKWKSSEEVGDKEENPLKEEKKEENKEKKDTKTDSSTKLSTEPQGIEAPKPLLSAVPAFIEKSEQERDVIKREAGNEQKLDEKKPGDMSKKDTDLLKKDKINSSQMKEKSPKGQDKPVH